MPDPDSSPPSQGAKRTNDYRIGTPPATPSLGSLLRGRIERDGPLGFPEFMAAALYEPGLGYYARGVRQVGRGGDFFTSVSVGPLFGQIMAGEFCAAWERLGKPDQFTLIEAGANVYDRIQKIQKLAEDAAKGTVTQTQIDDVRTQLDRDLDEFNLPLPPIA